MNDEKLNSQEESPQNIAQDSTEFISAFGKLLGLLVIVGGVALGTKSAWGASADQIWIFINVCITPAALGFLILIASEILGRMKGK